MSTGILIQAMRGLAARYKTKHGLSPYGYVMGIKDYRAVRLELGAMDLGGNPDHPALDGLPIFLKVTSGIELLVHREFAERLLLEESGAARIAMAKDAIIR